MKQIYRCICILAVALILISCSSQLSAEFAPDQSTSFQSQFIDNVWAGTGIACDAISVGSIVYIAYYDAERKFSIVQVNTLTHSITKKTLDSVFAGWDAHNTVVLAYDHFGYLHVSGNMHAVSLVYARTLKPNDFNSLTQTNQMIGRDESLVTYPNFFFTTNGDLLFSYRSGVSGNGVELINRFDGEKWLRLLSKPLFAPESELDHVNAYHTAYTLGSDGYYHLAWVWRQTPMVETNFNVGYARSKDLINWVDSRQQAVDLPITPANAEIVDAIPVRSGLFTNVHIGFDAEGKPIITYLKYDNDGNSQLYHARPNKNAWQITQATDWKYHWAFSGGGTLVQEISFSGVRLEGKRLVENVSHKVYGNMKFELDPITLSAHKIVAPIQNTPTDTKTVGSILPYIIRRVNIRPTTQNSVRGQIQWQSLPSNNNDKPRTCASVGLRIDCNLTSRLEIVNLVN